MARRFNNTLKWKNQRWFKLLDPYFKLSWEYINAMCDVSGVWNINCLDLIDDLRLPTALNLPEFVKACNRDWDAVTGQEFENERIILIKDRDIWITTFMVEQYLGKDKLINPSENLTRSAMKELSYHGKLAQAIRKGWLPLTYPYEALLKGLKTPLEGVQEREREKEREINREIIHLFFPDDGKKGKKREMSSEENGGSAKPPLKGIMGGVGAEQSGAAAEIPVMTPKEFLEFEELMLADEKFMDQLLMATGKIEKDPTGKEQLIKLEVSEIKKWITVFHVHIAAEEDLRKDAKKYKRHFKNWLMKAFQNGLPLSQQNGKPSNGSLPNGMIPPTIAEKDLKKYK